MSGPVRIELLPPELMGRRFQYALLSAAPESVRVDYASGVAEVAGTDHYLDLVETALEAIVTTLRWNRGENAETVIVGGVEAPCTDLDAGPRLYTSGVNDRKILEAIYKAAERVGAPKCYYTTRKGDKIPAWTHAAVTYAAAVLTSGGPLEGAVRNLPSLATSSVFSKVRTPGRPRDLGKQNVSLDALGAILLGGALAYAGSEALAGDTVELYLLPDTVSGAYWALRRIALLGGRTRNLAVRALRLLREIGVSLEPALALETAVALASMYKTAAELTPRQVAGILGSARLYLVGAGGKRPMVREGLVLSDILYQSFSAGLLNTVEAIAWMSTGKAVQARDEGASKHLAATCISELYMQAMDPCNPEPSYACAREALAYAENPRYPGEVRDRALTVAWLIERDAHALSRRAGCTA